MRRLPALVLVSLLALGALAASASAAPKQSAKTGLSIGKVTALIQLQHPRGLNHFVREVSDPSSPRYRDYASVESLVDRFGATEKTQKQVLGWLAARGVAGKLSPTGTFVTASLGRGRAARLLPAATADGASASAAGEGSAPAVPTALRGAVSSISLAAGDAGAGAAGASSAGAGASAAAKPKGERFGSIVPHSGTAGGCPAASTGGEAPGLEPFTPNQYLTAYGHAAMHAKGYRGEGQTVAVVEQGGFKRSDVATYAKCFGVEPPPISVQVVNTKAPAAEDETTLDLEQLTVGAPGLDHIYVYEGGESSLQNIILAAGTALGNPQHRPDVISISLGLCEPQIANALAWRDALDDIFAVAGGAGISVLVSAGDQGSTGCRGHFAENKGLTALPLQAVELPSSSPYATAVGGTNLVLSKKNTIKDEIVWNDSFLKGKGDIPIAGGGGGGVSILSPRTPWWQTGITRYGPGRKVPDLAALADRLPGYAYFCTAEPCLTGSETVPGWSAVGGTSAAAPLTAAGIALANQYAEKHGQPTLGFLNPLIYQLGASAKTRAAAFYDVTTGDNNITPALDPTVTGDIPVDCCQAKPGYDWASGWGSPKIAALAQLAAGAYR